MEGKWNKDRKRTTVGNYVMIGNFCDWKYMHLLFFFNIFLNIEYIFFNYFGQYKF